jgi:hypothetical protein
MLARSFMMSHNPIASRLAAISRRERTASRALIIFPTLEPN